MGQQAVTAFARAVGSSTKVAGLKDDGSQSSMATLSQSAERAAEVNRQQHMYDELMKQYNAAAEELKAERAKVVQLTADAAKFQAESSMKDMHIRLLQVTRAQYREYALHPPSQQSARPPPSGHPPPPNARRYSRGRRG